MERVLFFDIPNNQLMKEKLSTAFLEFYNNILDQAPHVLIGLTLLLIFIFLAKFARKIIKTKLITKVDDRMVVNSIARTISLILTVIGIILFLREVGWGDVAGGLLAGAGVSAIVIGFAFKDIGENLLAGFFLAFSRPFGIGDVIEVDGLKGVVQSMHFRNTHIRTYDGKDIYVPNAMLIKNPLINYTKDGLLRHDFAIGLDYGDDIPKAIHITMAVLKSYEHLAAGPGLEPFVMIDEYATSTINIRVFYWINHKEVEIPVFTLKNNLMNAIVTQLAKEGFSMPADILELKIYQEGKPIPLQIKKEES